jgi:predicted transcriptional regulator
VTQAEYQRYFEGSDQAVGIFLADAIAFEHPLSLESASQPHPLRLRPVRPAPSARGDNPGKPAKHPFSACKASS